ncbi:hypothetical protein ACEUZ9_004114 [Paracoccus litorisediminis]|uniref:hypothetical protein n=1 Tax=Paracoccus litorisediminis TaxID=2006130 RepID=UPI00373062F7
MTDIPTFDREKPQTVYDLLWSWSTGLMSKKDTIKRLGLDDEMELYEVCMVNDVPFPGTPSENDRRMAEEFLKAVIIEP